MKDLMTPFGLIMAIVGFVLCAVAGAARVLGSYHVMGFEAMTLLQGGTAMMIAACALKLYSKE